jgi:hypothetical protein
MGILSNIDSQRTVKGTTTNTYPQRTNYTTEFGYHSLILQNLVYHKEWLII